MSSEDSYADILWELWCDGDGYERFCLLVGEGDDDVDDETSNDLFGFFLGSLNPGQYELARAYLKAAELSNMLRVALIDALEDDLED